MPIAPRKVCRKAGCGALTSSTYCRQHQSVRKQELKQKDKERGTRTQRGYDNNWIRESKKFKEENPLCKRCEEKGILTEGNCVDHIIPHKGDKELFWDKKNWQTLCNCCHSEKTAKEDGGFSNPIRRI